MWQDEVSHLTCWTKQSGGERGRRRKEKRGKRREERSSNFSLEIPVIRQSISVGAKRKVLLRDESSAWVREYGVFAKLREVWGFPTWFIFSLKVI